MNPFDLPGPEFLALYIPLVLVTLIGAGALRWLLRRPAEEPPDSDLELGPYEVAYLAGGPTLVVNAALARMVNQDIVAVKTDGGKLKVSGALPKTAHAAELAIL